MYKNKNYTFLSECFKMVAPFSKTNRLLMKGYSIIEGCIRQSTDQPVVSDGEDPLWMTVMAMVTHIQKRTVDANEEEETKDHPRQSPCDPE